MSIQDAARAALVWWEGRTVNGLDLPTVMVAIAGAESGWRNDAPGDALGNWPSCEGHESWGLWQIHMPAHADTLQAFTLTTSPCYWAQWLSDPNNAARAADAVIGSAATDLPLSALHPWTVWWSRDHGQPSAGDGNGRYRDFLAQAAEAVAAERGGGFPPPPPAGGTVPGPILIRPPGDLLVQSLQVPMVGVGLVVTSAILLGLGVLALSKGDH